MTALAPVLQAFFTDRLIAQRHASGHTIAGYRDTFRLLLGFAAAKTGKKPVKKKVVKPSGPPAKELFGAAKTPAPMAARAIGFYAKGCLAGAAALPVDGPAWQAMRLSRNRNWATQSSSPWWRSWRSRRARTTPGLAFWSATSPSPAVDRCSAAMPATRSGSTPTSGSRPCPTGV